MKKLSVSKSVSEEDRQSGDVVAMAFHNGKLYTGAEGGKIMVYNADLTLHQTLQAQFNTVNAVCIFHGDLITTGNDGLIKVWDAATLELKKTLHGHEDEIRVLASHGGRLYSGDMNGKVKIWGEDYRVQFTLSCVEEVWSLAVNRDVIYTTRAIDVTCSQIGFKEIGTTGETRFVILDSFPGRGPLCITNTGDYVVYASQAGFELLVKENKSTHKDVTALQGHTAIVNALICVDNRLYSCGYDGLVKVWDAAALNLVAAGNTDGRPVYSIEVGDSGGIYAGLGNGEIALLQ